MQTQIISFHDFLLNQDLTPLRHKTREFGQMTPTFWRNLLPSSSGYMTQCHLFTYSEVTGNRILSNEETYIPKKHGVTSQNTIIMTPAYKST